MAMQPNKGSRRGPPTDVQPPTIRIVQETDGITALDLSGEFDISSSPEIVEHAERALRADQDLIINLSDATFIDSSVIHALFRTNNTAAQRGKRLVLQLATEPMVERVLAITSVTKHIAVATSRTDAIEQIQQNAH